jgi:hypothetical protein
MPPSPGPTNDCLDPGRDKWSAASFPTMPVHPGTYFACAVTSRFNEHRNNEISMRGNFFLGLRFSVSLLRIFNFNERSYNAEYAFNATKPHQTNKKYM